MNLENRIDRFLEIAERQGKEPIEWLIQFIESEIKYLQKEKRNLEIDKATKEHVEVRDEIKKIFEMLDRFEAQKQLYELKLKDEEITYGR